MKRSCRALIFKIRSINVSVLTLCVQAAVCCFMARLGGALAVVASRNSLLCTLCWRTTASSRPSPSIPAGSTSSVWATHTETSTCSRWTSKTPHAPTASLNTSQEEKLGSKIRGKCPGSQLCVCESRQPFLQNRCWPLILLKPHRSPWLSPS